MNTLVFAGLAFLFGTALGGAICFHTTADVYEEALDKDYEENLELRRKLSEYEDTISSLEGLIEQMKPVHCPTKQSKVSKIVTINWEDLDFPNSQEVPHD